MLTHSQNFLKNEELVKRLVNLLELNPTDTVLDIGSGLGIIAKELAKRSNNVIAIEPDPILANSLNGLPNINVVKGDFQTFQLLSTPFKVFSNIPFNQTADIVNKLLSNSNFTEGFLVLQKEAAHRFGGEQLDYGNSVLSVLYGIEFEFKFAYSFKREDFKPSPRFDVVLVRIRRRERLISEKDYQYFRDFLSYFFSKSTPNIGSLGELFSEKQFARFNQDIGLDKKLTPSIVSIDQYVYLFKFLAQYFPDKFKVFNGHYQKTKQLNTNMDVSHRTRLDPNWRNK